MSEYVSYGIPGIAFLGVLLLFWGVATLVGGGASESSMEARMARYAGGPEAKKEEKVKKKKERKDIDPFVGRAGQAPRRQGRARSRAREPHPAGLGVLLHPRRPRARARPVPRCPA